MVTGGPYHYRAKEMRLRAERGRPREACLSVRRGKLVMGRLTTCKVLQATAIVVLDFRDKNFPQSSEVILPPNLEGLGVIQAETTHGTQRAKL
jgi:hypothetical protein